jgi:hypothetical protein
VLAGLGRRQVPARPVRLRLRQRGLDQEQVGVARERAQRVGGGRVGAVGEARAAAGRGGDLDRVRRDEVRDGLEAERERADVQHLGRVVLAQVEGPLDQVLVAPRAHHAAEAVTRAGRRVERRAGRLGPAVRPVGQRVGERHEVEEVVGVQVRDDHRVHRGVVGEPAQLAEHAVAAVDEQAAAFVLHQVTGAGAVGVLP